MFPHCMLMGLFLRWPCWILTGKIPKHKNTCILKTVQDRAISTKFLTHRVGNPIFKKICLTKNGSHFEFSKNCVLQKLQNTKMSVS